MNQKTFGLWQKILKGMTEMLRPLSRTPSMDVHCFQSATSSNLYASHSTLPGCCRCLRCCSPGSSGRAPLSKMSTNSDGLSNVCREIKAAWTLNIWSTSSWPEAAWKLKKRIQTQNHQIPKSWEIRKPLKYLKIKSKLFAKCVKFTMTNS